MHSLRTFVLIGAMIVAIPAFAAGLQFTEVSDSGGRGGKTKMQVVTDGARFKATFIENPQGIPPVGTYVVGNGDGQMFIVSPAAKAYARFDRGDFSGMGQQAVGQMKHAREQSEAMGMTRTVENYKLEKVVDEAGPTTFGLPTRHYQYRVSYQVVMRVKGSPMAMTTTREEVHEFWSTTALGEVAKVPDFGGTGASTGEEAADKAMEAERVMAAHGMMLKSVVSSKNSQGGMGMMNPLAMLGGGRGSNQSATREIVALDRGDPPRDTFELPKDYQETDLMSLFTAAGSQMPDLNSLSGPGSKTPPAMPDLNKMGE
ncbi:MAG TPA: hypothetical protein VLW52_12115 [Opitutaceae bacterium]|nr:hypothetical protein [Opitutaceae bacterium]